MEEEVLQPDEAGGLDEEAAAARPAAAAPPLSVPVRAAKRDWALRSVIKGARPRRARGGGRGSRHKRRSHRACGSPAPPAPHPLGLCMASGRSHGWFHGVL